MLCFTCYEVHSDVPRIAHDVRFGGEIAGLSGGRMVLPNPGTEPSVEAAAAVRGRADALAGAIVELLDELMRD